METKPGETSVQVTGDSVDSLFKEPYIDVNELRSAPEPHRYVHGGFKGTQGRFSFYFPPAERYQGRFHHNTYPLCTSEDIGPFPIPFDVATGNLGFTLDSGAYYVQTNTGGLFRGGDPSLGAYRLNAAAAKYSRVVAQEIYGRPHRPFGYLYGGSGGAYQTIGAAEHTSGVWDGFMPFVLGSNNAVPSLWSVRLNALRVLRMRNKLPGVMDAINPGGSGDMYAGLNDEERAALKEATSAGYPPRGWYNHETLHNGYFSDVFGVIPQLDPDYAHDFWSKPGYAGSDPKASIVKDRFEFETTIARVLDEQPKRIVLANVPDKDLGSAHLVVFSGAATGKILHVASAEGNTIGFASTSDPTVVNGLKAGDKVRLDNSWLLAAHTYQRHQVPPSQDEYAWNQFRDSSGKPIYPQRKILIGHFFALHSVGALLSGRISAKTLLVQSMMDIDALAWCADWYRSEVKKAVGSHDNFALWFMDHCQHDNPQNDVSKAHTVRLDGPLQQGLRDLAQWVEKGVRPSETAYTVTDAQVAVPLRANDRKGIQATVELKVNGRVRAEVSVNQAISFAATIELPDGAGKIVAADWDFEGRGTYPVRVDISTPASLVTLSATHGYTKPGTYHPVLRATSQREGNPKTPYARIQNIARARVVVR